MFVKTHAQNLNFFWATIAKNQAHHVESNVKCIYM